MKVISFLRDGVSIHPFLIAVYFIIHYFIDYINAPYYWYEPIMYGAALYGITFVMNHFIARTILDKFNARYLVSSILTFILFFQDFVSLLIKLSIYPFRRRYLLLICGIIIVGLFLYLRKASRKAQPNLFLHLLLLIYLLFDFFMVVSNSHYQNLSKSVVLPKSSIKESNRPDIFFILLDGYTNSESLRKYYHFNNGAFLDSLKGMNFYIAKKSKSNYPFTTMTISSCLNLDYHSAKQKNITDQFLANIESNIFIKTLEKNSYIIHNNSIFQFEHQKSKYGMESWFSKSSLLFYYFSKSIFFDFFVLNQKSGRLERECKLFDSLDSTSATSNKIKPMFVYTHCILPHAPFYLNNKGLDDKEVYDRSPTIEELSYFMDDDSLNNTFGDNRRNRLIVFDYINHIQFTNTICLSSINKILKNKKRPTIIVLMSDHGSRMITNEFSYKEAVDERYTNFCAIYYSDNEYSNLYDSITPINVMRQILNKSVGTKYKNLKDISRLMIK